MDTKRRIDVELFLQWAFPELLKKDVSAGASSWQLTERIGGRDDGYGSGMPIGAGAPHPDALVVDQALRVLPEFFPIDWDFYREAILADLWNYQAARVYTSTFTFNMRASVMTHAKMKARPEWWCAPVKRHKRIGLNGKPIVIGHRGHGKYDEGAHCPFDLVPSLDEVALARAEYMVWRTGLDLVHESLKGWSLRDHVVVAAVAPVEPWLVDEEPAPARVLPSLERPQRVSGDDVKATSRRARRVRVAA
ncbi:hypothetical protein RA307_09890 [Xanthobacteraceae bacterium Astr-EGSB]|uniref:hypothetical protein n=1 Tax=Astrobacterium formosum TaxID=3069710 RepID=UPI0027B4C34C|nr:hypothetical protein [Xanthobacteraceae bacterium Astr-EGSB]